MFPRHNTHHLHVIIWNLIVDTELSLNRSLTMTQSKDQFDDKTKNFAILDVNILKKRNCLIDYFLPWILQFLSELFKLVAAKIGKIHNICITLGRRQNILFRKLVKK